MDALRWVPISVWWIAAGLAVMLFAMHAFKAALDKPTVQVSYDTKQCIKVINSDGTAGDCAHLPESYRSEWVY